MSALALWGLLASATAADWLTVQGTEPAHTEKAALRFNGFAQVSAEAIAARPVEGLTGDLAVYNGELATFNKVVGAQGPFKMSLRRIRVGVRGRIPQTDWISTSIAVEVGQNPLTTSGTDGWRPRLMDASITLESPAGIHLRMGQFKLPLADEALEAFHLTTDLVRFRPVTGRMLMERDALGGRINGFRDVGAQVFGSHAAHRLEVAWATMVSNGTVELGRVEPGVDLTARVQVSRPFDGPRRNPFRDELAVYGWATTGARRHGDDEVSRRTRVGGGVQARREGFRVRAEGMAARGMLNTGSAPPFAGGSLVIDPEGTAWGATLLASKRFADRWEVGVAGSHLDSLPNGDAARRVFDDVTAFGQLHVSKRAWFDLNLAWRHAAAPEGPDPAVRILGTMGPYAAVMVTVIP